MNPEPCPSFDAQPSLPYRIPWEEYELEPIQVVLEAANADADAASCFPIGPSIEEAQAMFFVVKGHAAVQCVMKLLAAVGYVTPGKPVVDAAPADAGVVFLDDDRSNGSDAGDAIEPGVAGA